MLTRRRWRGIGALLVLLVARSASAQDLTPPVLETFVDAPYPEEARREALEGNVTLVLDVDASGKVTAASVKEGAGHGFDEAALLAAKKFVFTPAQKDGKPVAARILYRYAFT